jgi:hypothetical protein
MKRNNPKTPTSRHWFSQFTAAVLIAILPSVTVAADLVPNAAATAQTTPPDRGDKRGALITILSPTKSSTFQGKSVAVILDVSSRTNRRAVDVTLNGRNVSGAFHDAGHCLAQGSCKAVATFSLRDGLKSGDNQVVVRAEQIKSGRDGEPRREESRAEFSWNPSKDIDLTDSSAMQLTPSVAFSTLHPGGQPSGASLFQIFSNALNGGTQGYPLATDQTCTTAYQVIVLDRKKLTEKSYSCYADDASLQIGLKALVPANPNLIGDLVILGTTWYNNAGSALNTTAIGGTDYTDQKKYPSSAYPQGYMMVGVAGAAAGSAYEVFNLSSEGGNGDYNARLDGLLSQDSNQNYSYHPSDNYLYSVDAANSKVTINGVVYTAPADANPGFWLLKIHRVKLWNEDGCTSNDGGNTYPNCGESYNTTTQSGMDALTSALQNLNSRDLVFLVACGQAFSAGAAISQPLAQAVESLGGSGYTLSKMTRGESATYTLISSSDPQFSKKFVGGSAVVSSSLFVNQFQTGSVFGVLARDLHNQFRPANSSQFSTMADLSKMDNSFFSLAWTQPGAWPDMDTTGRLGAYRYLSYQVIYNTNTNHPQGDDIHAVYTTSSNTDIMGADPTVYTLPSNGTWLDPVDGNTYTFTQDDLNAVGNQLKSELLDLKTVNNYMYASNGGVATALFDATSSGMLSNLLQAAGAAAVSLNQAQSKTNVSLNLADLSNFAGAALAVGAIFLDPEDLPLLALMSGMLWGAGSLGVLNPGSGSLPSPYVTLIANSATLSSQATTYAGILASTFRSSMDNINTDWNKLNQVAIKTQVNGAWQIQTGDSLSNVQTVFNQAAHSYFYTQIFSSLYQLDAFYSTGNKVSTPSQLGSGQLQGVFPYENTYCEAWYPKFDSTTDVQPFAVYPTPDSQFTNNDILYIGGELKNNNSANMSEQFASAGYVDTILGIDMKNSNQLNLNFDQFWSPNGPLTVRSGTAAPGYNGPLCTNLGKQPAKF